MAYYAQDLDEGSGFEYPPVPNTYTNPYPTSCSVNAYNHHALAPEDCYGSVTSVYPYYEHQPTSSTASICHFLYLDTGFESPHLQQIASVPSIASSPSRGTPTLVASTSHTPSPADTTKSTVITHSAIRKKRPRGTTGNIVCDACGYKFTVKSSLARHSKICRGKKSAKDSAKKSTSAQRKSVRTKDVGFMSDETINARPIIQTEPTSQVELAHNINLHAMSPASTVSDSPCSGNASLILGSHTLQPHRPSPESTQPYVPRGQDPSTDHSSFFCDICPSTFARRDILQLHKAQAHDLTEIPYLPDSGTIDTPPYLRGVTLEKSTVHSRAALRVFEGGALSSSPCHSCESKGFDCIVNPRISSRCSYCAHRDVGVNCGAAGVKYL